MNIKKVYCSIVTYFFLFILYKKKVHYNIAMHFFYIILIKKMRHDIVILLQYIFVLY